MIISYSFIYEVIVFLMLYHSQNECYGVLRSLNVGISYMHKDIVHILVLIRKERLGKESIRKERRIRLCLVYITTIAEIFISVDC